MAAGVLASRYRDRADAGRQLAARLSALRSERPLVLGLPRGGVVVAAAVATALGAPLDVLVVRKLGVPSQPELAMGAIGEDGVVVHDGRILAEAGVSDFARHRVEARERNELRRRVRVYRGDRPGPDVAGRTVVVVDDGLATGSTARAAVSVLRRRGAGRIVMAVPVGSPDAVAALGEVADEVVCPLVPPRLGSIGEWYVDFAPTADAEVLELLHRGTVEPDTGPGSERGPGSEGAEGVTVPTRFDVELPVGGFLTAGRLTVVPGCAAVVAFAHGRGSGRDSPRNVKVARLLQAAGFATLLVDLLAPAEREGPDAGADFEELGRRLGDATAWLRERAGFGTLPVGYLGAGSGAAAALWAASRPGASVGAVVSRGGRPDLLGERLRAVEVPTLLVVGGEDRAVLELNRRARRLMAGPSRLEVVPGAGHLFERPGELEAVAGLARRWFARHLRAAGRRQGT